MLAFYADVVYKNSHCENPAENILPTKGKFMKPPSPALTGVGERFLLFVDTYTNNGTTAR